MDQDFYLSVNHVAIILKVHPLTVRRYIKEGKLKAVRLAGNIRVPKSSLESFSKEVTPLPNSSKKSSRTEFASSFTLDDPIFRMKGRGLSLKPFA